MSSESTCFQIQYDPSLISVARVIHFGETLGDQVKARSSKKLKSLIEFPNVVHVKVHVVSINMILL